MTLCASQTYELLDAMEKDSGVKLDSLCVDGGVTKADTLLNIMAGVHNSLYFWFYNIIVYSHEMSWCCYY